MLKSDSLFKRKTLPLLLKLFCLFEKLIIKKVDNVIICHPTKNWIKSLEETSVKEPNIKSDENLIILKYVFSSL